MPRRRRPRPESIVCSCGAVVPVGARGVVPSVCQDCRRATAALALVEASVGALQGEVAVRAAKRLDRLAKRTLRRVGVL